MAGFLAPVHMPEQKHALSYLNGCCLKQCAATVVLFFPDNQVFQNLRQIIKQFELVVVVVNGISEDELRKLKTGFAEARNVIIHNSDVNIGVAAALNLGASTALKHGFAWMATFDQDSSIEPNFATSVAKNMSLITSCESFALLTPVHVGRVRGKRVGYCPILRNHGSWAEIGSVITSGNIISLKAWVSVGGFRESLFIDFVDYEYCFRLRKANFKLIMLRQVMMQHDIGEVVHADVLGFSIPLDGHGPFRYYYIVRNFLLIFPTYIFSNPWFFIRAAAAIIIKVGMLLIFDARRIAYASNVIRGLCDGLRCRCSAASEEVV